MSLSYDYMFPSEVATYNGWNTTSDWVTINKTSGKLPTDNLCTITTTVHTGNSERTGNIYFTYYIPSSDESVKPVEYSKTTKITQGPATEIDSVELYQLNSENTYDLVDINSTVKLDTDEHRFVAVFKTNIDELVDTQYFITGTDMTSYINTLYDECKIYDCNWGTSIGKYLKDTATQGTTTDVSEYSSHANIYVTLPFDVLGVEVASNKFSLTFDGPNASGIATVNFLQSASTVSFNATDINIEAEDTTGSSTVSGTSGLEWKADTTDGSHVEPGGTVNNDSSQEVG